MKLTLIEENKHSKRKAYANENGEVYFYCTKCGEAKHIDEFNNNKSCWYGKSTRCRDCTIKLTREWREKNVTRPRKERIKSLIGSTVNIEGNELTVIEVLKRSKRKAYKDGNGTIYVDCCKCNKPRKLDEYTQRTNRQYGIESYCQYCGKGFTREYRNGNKDKLAIIRKKWSENNKDLIKVYDLNRRALVRKLPATLTLEQREQFYAGGCCLTGDTDDLHLDHVIPVIVGHGGTTYENMIVLRGDLNISKSYRNIFVWAEERHTDLGFTMERFNEVMTEVAERNGKTLEEYKEYVYWCHNNQRVESDIPKYLSPKRRDSLERLNVALDMYYRGDTYETILNEKGIHIKSIYKVLEERGLPKREKEQSQKERMEQAITLYNEGYILSDIKKETGVDAFNLYDNLRRRDIKLRSEQG